MNLLAIDTAANLCAAFIYDTEQDTGIGRSVLDIGTGHAERLMGVIAEALQNAGMGYGDLGAIGVSVGPGSFTGVRIGVAAARGFALALKIPSIGVGTLDAVAEETRVAFPGRGILALIDARRDEIYAASYSAEGILTAGAMLTTVADMAEVARNGGFVLAGSAADAVAQAAGGRSRFDFGALTATADIAVYARLAAARGPDAERPKPLYLRGAGAKPQTGFALPRKAG